MATRGLFLWRWKVELEGVAKGIAAYAKQSSLRAVEEKGSQWK